MGMKCYSDSELGFLICVLQESLRGLEQEQANRRAVTKQTLADVMKYDGPSPISTSVVTPRHGFSTAKPKPPQRFTLIPRIIDGLIEETDLSLGDIAEVVATVTEFEAKGLFITRRGVISLWECYDDKKNGERFVDYLRGEMEATKN